jgi:hypothetical protein
LDLSKVNVSAFLFETCLRKDENLLSGQEKLSRLKEKSEFVRFGDNVFLGLWEDYSANEENSVLEYLYKTQKITNLYFFGTILRSPEGSRHVLSLYRGSDHRWHWGTRWLGNGWGTGSFSVGCAS